MKYFPLVFLFSLALLTLVKAQSIIRFDPPPDTETTVTINPEMTALAQDTLDRGAIEALLPYAANLASSQQNSILENPAVWHAPQYRMTLEISPSLEQLKGREIITYTNRTGKNLNDIGVLFLPNIMGAAMEVRNLRVNDAAPAGWQVEGNRRHALRIVLAEVLEPRQQVTLAFDFRIDILRDISDGYALLSLHNGILSLGHAYGLVASYDDDWQLAAPSLNGDLLYSEASFFQVDVQAHKDLVLASSGTVLHQRVQGDRQVFEIVSGPARDFFISASYDYGVVSRTVGEQRLRSFYLRSRGNAAREQATRMLETSARTIAFFSELFPSYPYSEFDIVPLETRALGMEFPGIIAMTTGLYSNADVLQGGSMRTRLENVTVHEVAHQWFYNLIGNDQQNEPWLDEGLTQYVTLLYHQTQNPEDYGYYYHEFEERSGRQITPLDSPVLSYDFSNYVRIIYGSLPLHLAEMAEYVGEDTFLRFLQDYTERYAWQQSNGEAFFTLLLDNYVDASRREGLERLLEPWFTLP